MRMALLASALAIVPAVAATAAERIKGTVGGYMLIGLVYQTDNSDELGVLRDGEIFLGFEGTSDNGLTFEGRVELEAFTTSDQIDENWASVSGSWGTIMIGSNDDAVDNHERGAFYAPEARIGYYDSFYSVLFSSNGNDNPMIRYSTPDFSGFQASIDWAPNAGADGATDGALVFGADNLISVGASWDGEFNGVSIGIGAGYQTFDGPSGDFSGWMVGGQVSYEGFSIGVQYDSAGNGGVEDEGAIAIGAEYATGPWTFGGGIAFSVDGPDTTNWGIWATYALAPGVSFTLGYEGNDTNTNETTVTGYLAMRF